jgi:hypothetical protein
MNLTLAQTATLKEMRSYEYYVFRQATARTLTDLGLAEIVPGDEKKVRPGRRLTKAGRVLATNLVNGLRIGP